jgi:molybdate transport system substrate-binding protein
MHFRRLLLGLAATLLCATALGGEPSQRPVTVFAAASLTNVLQRVGDEFTRSTGLPVRLVFAASSVLARQIEAGAGADVFISADQEWMDDLEQRGGIQKSSRRNLLGNRLALIAPASSTQQLEIAPGFPLAKALGGGRLATGDPDSVPVGRYAKSALTRLGVWQEVEGRLVRADDVRQALTFVARGEVPFGIVYATDARIDPRVRTVGIFPAETHLPITYPIALTHRAGTDASRFVEFLRGAAGRAVFEQAGFVVLQ